MKNILIYTVVTIVALLWAWLGIRLNRIARTERAIGLLVDEFKKAVLDILDGRPDFSIEAGVWGSRDMGSVTVSRVYGKHRLETVMSIYILLVPGKAPIRVEWTSLDDQDFNQLGYGNDNSLPNQSDVLRAVYESKENLRLYLAASSSKKSRAS